MGKADSLVSMITYCFNGERFVHKYFEAVLAQDYRNIELIFFNNGSTDRTGEIAEEYKPKLEAKGYKVVFRMDEEGRIHGYSLNQGYVKYKSSELGRTRGSREECTRSSRNSSSSHLSSLIL